MKNPADNVFEGILALPDEPSLFCEFVEAHDFSQNTLRAVITDIRKFARWFVHANQEPFDAKRVTTRDVGDFRNHLRREKNQAVSTCNRNLCSIRKYLGYLAGRDHLQHNPAEAVKELRRQQLAPKGLSRSQVRKLLREIELRNDVRANAIFSTFLYTGCRVSDLVQLELTDVIINERSGSMLFRYGKGGKQRSVPLNIQARRAMLEYLNTRPPVESSRVFIGERGPLTDRGVRQVCDKYSAFTGFKIHPHLLRHTFAHQFLRDTSNDLVALAQILGHSNVNTAARYSQRSEDDLAVAAEQMTY